MQELLMLFIFSQLANRSFIVIDLNRKKYIHKKENATHQNRWFKKKYLRKRDKDPVSQTGLRLNQD